MSVELSPFLHTELSIKQVAETMHVSDSFVTQLLDEGKIPYRLEGTYRCILVSDILVYLEGEKQQRKEVLKNLIAEQEQLGLYE